MATKNVLSKKKLLFVCSFGEQRSVTAAQLFANEFSTRAKGIVDNDVLEDDVTWADVIVVMEEEHKQVLEERLGNALKGKKLIVLDIPSVYLRNDPKLIALLRQRFEKLVRPLLIR